MAGYPIAEQRTLEPGARARVRVGDITVASFAVVHSLRAPAVGYRISAGRPTVFYVPDVVAITEPSAALAGLDLYIGDGATVDRPLVRYRDGRPFGHTTLTAQIDWCAEFGVGHATFTHCGTQIVTADERTLAAKVRAIGRQRGVDAELAHDGMEKVLR